MTTFLVEAYATRARSFDVAFERLTASPVRHVRTTFVPDDEMCLHLIEAGSVQAVREALSAAAIPYERIVEAIE